MSSTHAGLERAALDLAAIAADCRDVDDIRDQLLPALAAATGSELAIYHQVSVGSDAQEHGVPWPNDAGWASSLAPYPPVMRHSPLIRHFVATRSPGVVTLRQLVTARAWHENPVYRESHRSLGVEDHLAVVLAFTGDRGHAITLARPYGVFQDAHSVLLALTAPHLRAAVRRSLASSTPYRALRTVPTPTWTVRVGPAIPRRSDGRRLTDRESEVFALVVAGRGTREVARQLGIAPRTADKHLENVFRKLGANSRTDAAARLLEHGMGLEASGG